MKRVASACDDFRVIAGTVDPFGGEFKAAKIAVPVAGKITGYTAHGLERALSREGRGVATRAILDAVRSPISAVKQSGGRTMYVGRDAVVVLNKTGKIITTWAKKGGWRIP